LHVTNLLDSGAGSLRAALSVNAPRNIVFDVSGTIALTNDVTSQSRIEITNPYVTIKGETSPEGITIQGTLHVKANEVIIRHLRVRPGAATYDPDNGDCLTLTNCSNVVIDHCSLEWSTDELLNIWADGLTYGTVENVTICNCILAEGLYNSTHSEGAHSMGPFVSGGAWSGVSFYSNLIAHCNYRVPQFSGNPGSASEVEFSNNVIYDTPNGICEFLNGFKANIIANYFKFRGRDYSTEYKIDPASEANQAVSQVYFAGNKSDQLTGVVRDSVSETPSGWNPATAGARIDMPIVTTTDAQTAYSNVLANAGASPRDATDARIISQVTNRTGGLVDEPPT
jgi:hypothetical protein